MLYAFFDATGALDRAAFRQQVDYCIAAGCQGIAVLGLITEVKALSPAERSQIVRWAAEDIAGRVPLVATIAGADLGEVTALAAEAAPFADWLVFQPPLGGTITGPALVDFYSAAMAATDRQVGIQNAPEFLGVGLNADEVLTLARRHAHFTLMKAEGPVVVVKPFIDALDGAMAVFNGRGGLELPDNLLAGCAGMIPAPDTLDIQLAIFAAVRAGRMAEAARLYAAILPYVVFAMQHLDIAIGHGKKVFAARAGIVNDATSRVPQLGHEAFFAEARARWAAGLDGVLRG